MAEGGEVFPRRADGFPVDVDSNDVPGFFCEKERKKPDTAIAVEDSLAAR